jgi:hypothetical protein
MRRWVIPLTATILTSAIGVAINLATETGSSIWAWVVVAVLTIAAAVLGTMTTQPKEAEPPPAVRSTNNSISGTVHGQVVQAGDITGNVTMRDGGPVADPEHPR